MSRIFRGITRNVFVLGLVSLFNDISSEMLYPIIPIFLTAVLGAPVAVVGIVEGVAEATANILKVFSGVFSDKFSRKPFVIAGYSLSTIAKPMLALAYSWPFVLLARVVDRFGKGIRTSARDAMIADSSLEQYRGKAFGLHRAMDTCGAIIGPLLLLLFLSHFQYSYRTIFIIAAIPAAIGIALLAIFVREKNRERPKQQPIDFSMKRLGKPFAAFLLVYALFALGNSSDAFLILRAKSFGFSTVAVVLAYILYNITYAVSSGPAGALADKLEKKHIVGIGFLIFSFVYAGFAFLGAHAIWLLFIVYGFYTGLTDGVSKAYITTLVPKDRRGAALGIFFALTGTLTLFASIIAGLLWSRVSPAAPFIYGSVLAFMAGVLLFTLQGKEQAASA